MSLDIEVRGLRELLEKIEGFPEWERQARRDALRTVGEEMERFARIFVPVRTGRLRRSIYSRVVGEVLHFGAAMRYARYVEEGTRRMWARPFLGPAKEMALDMFPDLIREKLRRWWGR